MVSNLYRNLYCFLEGMAMNIILDEKVSLRTAQYYDIIIGQAI